MNNKLGQFFTPAWAAEYLWDAHFGHLTGSDMVWEPTCGSGILLAAIPAHIPCIGTEIDPLLAQRARIASRRPVITGSCLEVVLPGITGYCHQLPDVANDCHVLPPITAVFGNPPFSLTLFDQLLQRCAEILAIGNKAGFIIPAYFLQTSRTVMALGRKWGIHQEILPRDLFRGLSKPLIFANFIRDSRPQLIGFRLFPELAAIKELSARVQEDLSTRINGTRSVWRETVKAVIQDLGGTAPLSDIYRHMEGRRPTANQFWKEKVRQVCQQSFSRVQEGVYSINNN